MTYLLSQVPGFRDRSRARLNLILMRLKVPMSTAGVCGYGLRISPGCHVGVMDVVS